MDEEDMTMNLNIALHRSHIMLFLISSYKNAAFYIAFQVWWFLTVYPSHYCYDREILVPLSLRSNQF